MFSGRRAEGSTHSPKSNNPEESGTSLILGGLFKQTEAAEVGAKVVADGLKEIRGPSARIRHRTGRSQDPTPYYRGIDNYLYYFAYYD